MTTTGGTAGQQLKDAAAVRARVANTTTGTRPRVETPPGQLHQRREQQRGAVIAGVAQGGERLMLCGGATIYPGQRDGPTS